MVGSKVEGGHGDRYPIADRKESQLEKVGCALMNNIHYEEFADPLQVIKRFLRYRKIIGRASLCKVLTLVILLFVMLY